MIIYGVRNKSVLREDIIDNCENCGNNGFMEMHIFQSYFHVFWIPFVPVNKFGVTQCNHCKQVLKNKEMPQKLKATYNGYKPNAKTPWWMFIGLAGLILLIFSVGTSIANDNKKSKEYLQKPAVGDIYHIKTESNNYTLYRIAGIEKDSIFFEINNFESNLLSGLNKLENKENKGFGGIIEGLTKKEILQMSEKGKIDKITRN